jgi:hypothetical protein
MEGGFGQRVIKGTWETRPRVSGMDQDRHDRTGLGSAPSELPPRPLVAMAPEYRRSVVYVLIGLVVLTLVARWANQFRPPENRPDPRVVAAIATVMAVAAGSLLRWRLRVDGRGIARRRLVGWHLFGWDELASGRVSEGVYTGSYVFPDRPFWNRTLSLGMIPEADRNAIQALILRVWVRPPEPEIPPELAFRFFFRNIARLGPGVLTIVHRGEEHRYAWGEVRALKIRRSERARRDFSSLELVLPDRTVTLRVVIDHGRANPSWSRVKGQPKPDPVTVAAALLAYVPRDRVVITSLSEPPLTLAEWDDRYTLLEKKEKELTSLRRVFWVALPFLLACCFWDTSRGWVPVVGMLVACSMYGVVFWAVYRSITAGYRRSLKEFESQFPGRTPGGSTSPTR